MPYIKPERRKQLDISAIEEFPQDSGELNYMFTQIINWYIFEKKEKYQTYNDIIGALEGAKLELYARKIRPYEDIKIQKNGDVYDTVQTDIELLSKQNMKEIDDTERPTMNLNDLKDPNADPNCDACHGWGRVSFGNVCSGFGAEIESMECNCVMYKKLGIDMKTGKKIPKDTV